MWFPLSGPEENAYTEGSSNLANCDKAVTVESSATCSYEDSNNTSLVSDKIELACIENLSIFI